jgi:ferredoxin
MDISRKDFFRRGLLSLGKTALDLAGALKAVPAEAPEAEQHPPQPRPDMMAVPFNERCLARECGCFICSERCESGAVMVVPGQGVRIDGVRCTGCGTCEYICPVTPKAVALVPREGT